MAFDFSRTDQSTYNIYAKWVKPCYEQLDRAVNKTQWIRLACLPFGLCLVITDLVVRIAEVGESIIKGFGNIFGSFFSAKCSASIGAKQIGTTLPTKVLYLAFWPITGIVGIVVAPIWILAHPKSFTELGLRATEKVLANTPMPVAG